MQKTVGTNSNVFFPLYDAHGNMVATLSRGGTGWSLSDQRSYDAWGQVRAGVANGDPSGRYCANLGHKQDDESGLIYMRARYYEPGSGRFISQDTRMDGSNWFAYCANNPIDFVDESGRKRDLPSLLGAALVGFLGYLIALCLPSTTLIQAGAAVAACVLAEFFELNSLIGGRAIQALTSTGRAFANYAKALEKMYDALPPPGTLYTVVLMAAAAYAGAIFAELFAQELEL